MTTIAPNVAVTEAVRIAHAIRQQNSSPPAMTDTSVTPANTDMTVNTTPTANTPSVSFVVTGFGPFANVPLNPTTVLVQHLHRYLQCSEVCHDTTADSPQSNHLVDLDSITHTTVLETSAIYARKFLDELHQQLRPPPKHNSVDDDGNNLPPRTNQVIVLVHLGVNYQGKTIAVEQCAYNDATFRVPDQTGFCPQQVNITESVPLKQETSLQTSTCSFHHLNKDRLDWQEKIVTLLPVMEIVANLNVRSTTHVGDSAQDDSSDQQNNVVTVSTDPGRFVCNYTYFYSLYKFGGYERPADQCQLQLMNRDGERIVHAASAISPSSLGPESSQLMTFSLFVHVPPFEVISKTVQFRCITKLLVEIHRQLSNNKAI